MRTNLSYNLSSFYYIRSDFYGITFLETFNAVIGLIIDKKILFKPTLVRQFKNEESDSHFFVPWTINLSWLYQKAPAWKLQFQSNSQIYVRLQFWTIISNVKSFDLTVIFSYFQSCIGQASWI